MSEIVFTETEKRRDRVDYMEGGRIPTDRKNTLFQSRDKVALVSSVLVCGVPRGHLDKRYYYWRSTHSLGMRRINTGTVVPYVCSRPWDSTLGVPWKHQTPGLAFELLDPEEDTPGATAYKRAIGETFNIKSINDVYPMLGRYNLSIYRSMPNTLRSSFRLDDWEVFAQKAFGKTRTDRRLVAAVQNTEPYFVSYAQQFRGLVDDSLIKDFLENNHFDDEMEESFQSHSTIGIRKLLLHARQETRDNLIKLRFDNVELNEARHFATSCFSPVVLKTRVAKETYSSWKEVLRW